MNTILFLSVSVGSVSNAEVRGAFPLVWNINACGSCEDCCVAPFNELGPYIQRDGLRHIMLDKSNLQNNTWAGTSLLQMRRQTVPSHGSGEA